MFSYRPRVTEKKQGSPSASSTLHKSVIAIDGPSASGKGTLGKLLAERLNYAYLDTGTLYRAVGVATLEMGGNPTLLTDVRPALDIVLRNLTPELLQSAALRTPEASDAASKVSSLPEVRIALVDYQRAFAANPPGDVGGAVLDGRDIGTVICPNADMKFFITADVEERARRRYAEMKAKHAHITPETVLEEMQARDKRDAERTIAPTRAADDAVVLDMTSKTPQEGLEAMIAAMREKILAQVSEY